MTKLIVWDEAPLCHRYVFEAVDRTLQDITQVDAPFGGITVLFGGDFRQVLPVVKRGNRAAIVNASLKRSYLWRRIQTLKLEKNMRVVEGGERHKQFLLDVGEDSLRDSRIPEDLLLPNRTLDGLLDFDFRIWKISLGNLLFSPQRIVL